MNRFSFALCITIWIAIIPLSATNQLDIMHILQGEYDYSGMGMSLASLDFNGDGIKDLIVHQSNNPRPEHQGTYVYGRLMVMYGGDNFDTIPELTIFGNPDDLFLQRSLFNVGDMNNDGFEDFVVIRYLYDSGLRWLVRLCIFFGGENPSTTPGFQYDYPAYDYDGIAGVNSVTPFALADINGDGYSDIGIVCDWGGPDRESIDILYGGTFNFNTVYDTYYDVRSIPVINGVGDVNSDGYEDFAIGHSNNNYINNRTVTLYYGCPDIAQCDSLTLVAYSTTEWSMKPMAGGDVNGDGYDDFLGRDILENNIGYGLFWLGGTNLTNQHDVVLWPDYFGTSWADHALIHGDLNGDGYEDLIGSNYARYADGGVVAIWLGKPNFNGLVDLYLTSPPNIPGRSRFGYAMACGDFNNDGFDDLAVGAPQSPPGLSGIPGAVVIYSGNALLADTTVANEDELAVPMVNQWQISTYPNPLINSRTLTIDYQGKGYQKVAQKDITIYNQKGQKVHRQQDNSQGKNWTMQLPELASGVYFLRIAEGNVTITSHKFIITK